MFPIAEEVVNTTGTWHSAETLRGRLALDSGMLRS
jgi:hypothetical protein